MTDDPLQSLWNRVRARGCAEARTAELATALEAFQARHQNPDSPGQTTAYHNLVSLLYAEPIADFMIDHPAELLEVVARLRELTGHGAHNAFFTLGLPHIAPRFAADPALFVRLATIAGVESIGAFPALKGERMSDFFARDPEAYLAFVGEVVSLLGVRAGQVLNVLYNDPLARCFAQAPARYLELLRFVRAIDDDVWPTVVDICFRDAARRDAFVELFDESLSREQFAESVRRALATWEGPIWRTKPAANKRRAPAKKKSP